MNFMLNLQASRHEKATIIRATELACQQIYLWLYSANEDHLMQAKAPEDANKCTLSSERAARSIKPSRISQLWLNSP